MTPTERTILAAVSETTPMSGREIAAAAFDAAGASTRGTVFLALAKFKDRGWIKAHNDCYPAMWTRTAAGVAALAEKDAI